MIYVTLGLQICNVQRKYLFDIRKYVTYFCGSNMLDNMKHCVAMGGAAWGGGCGCAITGAIFKAFAAAGGISRPVPSANLNISCNLQK